MANDTFVIFLLSAYILTVYNGDKWAHFTVSKMYSNIPVGPERHGNPTTFWLWGNRPHRRPDGFGTYKLTVCLSLYIWWSKLNDTTIPLYTFACSESK